MLNLFYRFPFDISTFKTIRIIYSQNDEPLVVKTNTDGDVKASGNSAIVTLTQEDTFKFSDNGLIKIQIRLLSSDGKAIGTKPISKSVQECLEEEVME